LIGSIISVEQPDAQYMKEKVAIRRKSFPNEKGQVFIFVTLAFVVLGMFIGLAVDGGRAYLMHQRLRKIVDAAALAGAKAMAGPTDPNEALNAARIAACDSAKVNGIASGDSECGESGTILTVTIGDVTNPDGTTQQGVIVTGTNTASTFFMRLGGLIGCETCTTINVQATSKAAPDTLVDVVLVLDDSGTMNHGCVTFTEPGCPIRGAKEGTKTLVNMLLADPNSHAKLPRTVSGLLHAHFSRA
jgi:Flp pilus assembly protein TadG